ncbi:MAG TPA: hypothetical protein VGH44_00620 [Candidatus Saccharimonadia bacterium]
MKLIRMIGAASLAGGLMLASAGSALADSTVGIDTTGPNSTNDVTVDNSMSVTTTNTNNVRVVNANLQQAQTGNVAANDNTTVGGLGSGNASNQNAAETSVSINNAVASVPGQGNGGGNQPGSGNGSNGGTVSGVGGGNVAAPGKGGSVLGAMAPGMGAGAPAMLPVTGASVPVDVSALRAAWHPQSADVTSPVKKTGPFSTFMLLTAAVLSLMGAAGSAVYARRAERRV